jgi:hypothetical protein
MDTKDAGRLGGKSRSPAKVAAGHANMAKARAARKARRAAESQQPQHTTGQLLLIVARKQD